MKKKLIQIFAKIPVPAKVKTRLIPSLGAYGACQFYSSLLTTTIKNSSFTKIDAEIWLYGKPNEAFNKIIDSIDKMQIHRQQGDNLGDRMHFALVDGLTRADYVVLVGSDCPAITSDHYVELFKRLERHDLVFIPAIDGGYVAIGARKIDKDIFKGITWGGNMVYKMTLSKAQRLGLSVSSLQALRDIDTPEDLIWQKGDKI